MQAGSQEYFFRINKEEKLKEAENKKNEQTKSNRNRRSLRRNMKMN